MALPRVAQLVNHGPKSALACTLKGAPGELVKVNWKEPLISMHAPIKMGDATEIAPGVFQFTDAHATGAEHRFYRVSSP